MTHRTDLTRIISAIMILLSAAGANGTRTVNFEPDTLRVLRNPLQGWVMYLGRTWDENFWEEKGYDHMKTTGGTTTVRVSDYASCAYIRTSWVSFEPEEGKYAWNDPDSRLMRLLRSVRERGLRIAFRIVIDGRDQGQNTHMCLTPVPKDITTRRTPERTALHILMTPCFRRNIQNSSASSPVISTTRMKWSSSMRIRWGNGVSLTP